MQRYFALFKSYKTVRVCTHGYNDYDDVSYDIQKIIFETPSPRRNKNIIKLFEVSNERESSYETINILRYLSKK